ncbi:phage tail assembly chaperone [Aureimonas ureilytica]|uniref:phage tail assembly chaperone n=1 Tax=Aureimonas ureilytica TaxID=401562 RepID=UPI00036EFCCF|nr:hypothetical protein [Aureimonas ureilytica]
MAEKRFGSITYKTDALPAREALKLWYRLIKALGPAVERLPEIFAGLSSGDEAAKAKANASAIAAIMSILNGMDEDRMMALLDDILAAAMLKRPSGSWDKLEVEDFEAKLSDVFPVAAWIVREQFGDFFSGLLKARDRGATAPA